jgi:hypothetical protein
VLIPVCDLGIECRKQLTGTGPILEPQALFCDHAPDALGIGVALWVVVTGKSLLDAQRLPGRHDGQPCWLRASAAHQRQSLLASNDIGELTIYRSLKGEEPVLRCALHTGRGADDHLGVPIQPDNTVDPAEAFDEDLRYVDPPPRIGLGLWGFAPAGCSLRLQPQIGRDQQMVLPPRAQNARGLMTRRYAQMRGSPQNGCSAFSAGRR